VHYIDEGEGQVILLFFVMANRCGVSSIGTSLVACAAKSDRVSGMILGNTWFGRNISQTMQVFSRFTATGFMQRRFLENN
jgi:hypothetical protein